MFRIKIEVTDEAGEVAAGGATMFHYDNIGTFGDCEIVDEEVGKIMRRLVHKVEAKEGIHELEAELLTHNN